MPLGGPGESLFLGYRVMSDVLGASDIHLKNKQKPKESIGLALKELIVSKEMVNMYIKNVDHK